MRKPTAALVALAVLVAGCSFAPESREPATVLHLPAEYAAAPMDSITAAPREGATVRSRRAGGTVRAI